jgi:hypothetical protein
MPRAIKRRVSSPVRPAVIKIAEIQGNQLRLVHIVNEFILDIIAARAISHRI